MTCFKHAGSEDVGFCKHCCKNLCHDCLVDCGDGLACGECAEKVRDLNRFMENSIHKKTNTPFVSAFMSGLFFITAGISMWRYDIGYLSLGFVLFGCTSLFTAYRYWTFNHKK